MQAISYVFLGSLGRLYPPSPLSSSIPLCNIRKILKQRGEAMFTQLLLFHFILSSVMVASQTLRPHCQQNCGNVNIPYPFGIGEGCYRNIGFKVTCNNKNYSTPKAFQGTGNIEILSITLDEVRINGRFAKECYDGQGIKYNSVAASLDLKQTPLRINTTRNKFTAMGCDTIAIISDYWDQDFQSGCVSVCNNSKVINDGSCSGVGCCQTPIPSGLRRYSVYLGSTYNHTNCWRYNPCSYAFLADEEWFTFKKTDLYANGIINRDNMPVVLDWAIGNETCQEAVKENFERYACGRNSLCVNSTNGPGYRCLCKAGYDGNPYLLEGCQDINECEKHPNPCHAKADCENNNGGYSCSCQKGYHGDATATGSGCTLNTKPVPVIQLVAGVGIGFLFLIVCCSLLYRVLKQRKLIKLREKFFQQNGGMLLQQQISSRKGVSEIAKIFTVDDLKRATNNYDESRILGQGGYGTVYKGILPDKRVVAIKKSKIMDQSQIIQFINEVDILSQINHRNVVKLLGCCLETEVPMLVYEFISNGTLFQHIHNRSNGSSPLSWENRLRIAAETAGALAYLHSAHSIPVLHRDVKSSNILLDENYITKVSDFGASRLVPLDQTQMTTLVQGTLGYLDPECFHTGQLTEKSDVYSFGVVLVELLTGEKSISSERSEEHRSLAMFFVSAIKEDRLFQILEKRVENEGDKEQLLAVAELARRCIKVKGEDRPTMKEVSAELDQLRKYQEHPWVQKNQEETVYLLGEPSNSYSVDVTGQESLMDHYTLELEMAAR